jgi:predicted HTH transcriptional regulator
VKQPWAWAEEDLLAMVAAKQPEGIDLDYKGSDALMKIAAAHPKDPKDYKLELCKDVSSFANSGGGTLVYGIAEDSSTHFPKDIDDGIDPAAITADRIEQVLNSGIHRRVEGVRIQAVPLTKTRTGRVAYVVHVAQSMRAPHQVGDGRFYKRHEREARWMEEYEVRDTSHRNDAPALKVVMSVAGPIVPADSRPGNQHV